MPHTIKVRTLLEEDIDRCRDILDSLPDWFGLEESNRAYVQSLAQLPGAAACLDEHIAGFIALAEHTPTSFEIHVMAVDPARHRKGAFEPLFETLELWGQRTLHSSWSSASTRSLGEFVRVRISD